MAVSPEIKADWGWAGNCTLFSGNARRKRSCRKSGSRTGSDFYCKVTPFTRKRHLKKGNGGDRQQNQSSHAPSVSKVESKIPSSNLTFHTFTGLQVLVVDNDTDTREYITKVLQQHGANVTAVASVRQALSTIEKSPPDVLVSDIGMPEEDGYTLIRKLRNLEPEIGGQIPAIALTAYVREQDCDRALEFGFQEYVTKPVEATHLINSVTKLIQHSKS